MYKSSIENQGNDAKPFVVRSLFLDAEIPNFQQEFVSKVYADITKKKEDLIKQKLVEKGFGHLIDGIEKRRFPKICCVIKDGWSFYFADNDTDEGFFIVAIEDFKLQNDSSLDRSVNMTVAFNWQDTYCGVVSFAR